MVPTALPSAPPPFSLQCSSSLTLLPKMSAGTSGQEMERKDSRGWGWGAVGVRGGVPEECKGTQTEVRYRKREPQGQVLVTHSCPTLCNPMGCNLPGSSVQARILGWVAIPFSRGSSPPRDQTLVSCIAGRFFTV